MASKTSNPQAKEQKGKKQPEWKRDWIKFVDPVVAVRDYFKFRGSKYEVKTTNYDYLRKTYNTEVNNYTSNEVENAKLEARKPLSFIEHVVGRVIKNPQLRKLSCARVYKFTWLWTAIIEREIKLPEEQTLIYKYRNNITVSDDDLKNITDKYEEEHKGVSNDNDYNKNDNDEKDNDEEHDDIDINKNDNGVKGLRDGDKRPSVRFSLGDDEDDADDGDEDDDFSNVNDSFHMLKESFDLDNKGMLEI